MVCPPHKWKQTDYGWQCRVCGKKSHQMTLYQYGSSEPAPTESEAFDNWFRDTHAIVGKIVSGLSKDRADYIAKLNREQGKPALVQKEKGGYSVYLARSY